MSGPVRSSSDTFLIGGHQVEKLGRCELTVVAPLAYLSEHTGLLEGFEPSKGLLLTRPDRGADRRGRHDRLCRKKGDALGRRGTGARSTSPLHPFPLESSHLVGESRDVDRRFTIRVREGLDPLGYPPPRGGR